MTAEYKVHGSVAVITLSNPPVNGLGLATRQGIVDGLARANADAAVKSIVITGAGGAFSGGADIKEFGTDKSLQEPNLLWEGVLKSQWQATGPHFHSNLAHSVRPGTTHCLPRFSQLHAGRPAFPQRCPCLPRHTHSRGLAAFGTN